MAFLAKKEFRYAVVPEAQKYMNEQLAVTAYPTHLLIDRKGIIKKVTNSIEDLIPSLEKEIQEPRPGSRQMSLLPALGR